MTEYKRQIEALDEIKTRLENQKTELEKTVKEMKA